MGPSVFKNLISWLEHGADNTTVKELSPIQANCLMILVSPFLVRIFCVILCILCSPNRLGFVKCQCHSRFPISMIIARSLCSWILPNLTVYPNFNNNYFPVMPTIMLLCTVDSSLLVQSGQVLIFTSIHKSFYVQLIRISTATRGKIKQCEFPDCHQLLHIPLPRQDQQCPCPIQMPTASPIAP